MLREYLSWLGLFTTHKDVSSTENIIFPKLLSNLTIGYKTPQKIQNIRAFDAISG